MQTLWHRSRRFASLLAVVALFWTSLRPLALAQPNDLGKEAYLMPPKEIADALLALRQENVALTNLSPDGKKFLITRSDGMPTLQRMAQPRVYLGEMAFDPVGCRAHGLWVRSSPGFDLFFYAENRKVPVQVPDRARVSNPVWSPDGTKLAFYAHFEDATHIYLADTDTGYSRKLTNTPVLATLVSTFQWSKDGKKIQTVLLPDEGKRETPKRNGVPTEPKVRVARDGKNPSRTYRYLLESPHDMKLLEHLLTGQLAVIDVPDGKVTKVGFPNLIRSVSMAPGEEGFRVSVLKKPFSYYVPLTRFGSHEGIWNLEGKSLYTLADRKLQETEPQPAAAAPAPQQPMGKGKGGGKPRPTGQPPAANQPQPPADPDNPGTGTPTTDPDGRRDLAWRPDGQGMSYLQLEPAQAKDDKAIRKDRVMQWLAPYGKDDVKVVYAHPAPNYQPSVLRRLPHAISHPNYRDSAANRRRRPRRPKGDLRNPQGRRGGDAGEAHRQAKDTRRGRGASTRHRLGSRPRRGHQPSHPRRPRGGSHLQHRRRLSLWHRALAHGWQGVPASVPRQG